MFPARQRQELLLSIRRKRWDVCCLDQLVHLATMGMCVCVKSKKRQDMVHSLLPASMAMLGFQCDRFQFDGSPASLSFRLLCDRASRETSNMSSNGHFCSKPPPPLPKQGLPCRDPNSLDLTDRTPCTPQNPKHVFSTRVAWSFC